MIEFVHKVGMDKEVYIHCSTNEEERSQIRTLLDQIRTICTIVGPKGNTGLRTSAEITVKGCLCAILSLTTKIGLSASEIDSIRMEITQRQLEPAKKREAVGQS